MLMRTKIVRTNQRALTQNPTFIQIESILIHLNKIDNNPNRYQNVSRIFKSDFYHTKFDYSISELRKFVEHLTEFVPMRLKLLLVNTANLLVFKHQQLLYFSDFILQANDACSTQFNNFKTFSILNGSALLKRTKFSSISETLDTQ